MNKIVLSILFYLLFLGVNAQEGVKFMEGSFKDALESAKLEKKLLFVDAYTSWCGPCRWMSEKIFPTREAGDFFNKHFVCFKVDVGKGEGVELARKYDIHAYPTFLIILPDGMLRHKVVGGDSLKVFIPKVKQGLKEKTSWAYFVNGYTNGTLRQKEIPQAIQVFEDAYMKTEVGRLADSLFDILTLKEKLDERYWIMYKQIKYNDLFSNRLKFLVESRMRIAGGEHGEEGAEIIRTQLSDHLLNNTSGRITSKENPWILKDANEMPYIRTLIEASDIPDKMFFLAWCDLASACYYGQAERVREEVKRITVFPEARMYATCFAGAFQRYFPDEEEELKRLRELWDLDENNYRKGKEE